MLEKGFFEQFVFMDDMSGLLGNVIDVIQQTVLTALVRLDCPQ